jgi:hypothetical protein
MLAAGVFGPVSTVICFAATGARRRATAWTLLLSLERTKPGPTGQRKYGQRRVDRIVGLEGHAAVLSVVRNNLSWLLERDLASLDADQHRIRERFLKILPLVDGSSSL